jgi:hypothetical protein
MFLQTMKILEKVLKIPGFEAINYSRNFLKISLQFYSFSRQVTAHRRMRIASKAFADFST